jgi:hypothetical protein
MKKYIAVIIGVFLLTLTGCRVSVDGYNQTVSQNEIVGRIQQVLKAESYTDILKRGAEPSIPAGYKFPNVYQYENGCFGFALKNIAKYKYNDEINMTEAERKINKPRKELWSNRHITDFLNEYGYELKWYSSAEDFFKLLRKGEPVIIQYKYPVSRDRWIGHYVAVYSFDKGGVWIAQTMTNKLEHLPYEKVFNKDGTETQFVFAIVLRKNANEGTINGQNNT